MIIALIIIAIIAAIVIVIVFVVLKKKKDVKVGDKEMIVGSQIEEKQSMSSVQTSMKTQ